MEMEVLRTIILIIFISPFFFIAICHTEPLSFNYTNLDKCSDSIKLFDSAVCVDSGIELTGFEFYVTGQDYLTEEWVVFGFSASTAFRYQSHTIKTWSFSSDLDSEGGPTMVKQEVSKSNTNTHTMLEDSGTKKTNKTLIIGLVLGIISVLTIILIVGTVIWARSNKRPGRHLRLESGRRNPEGFLRARTEHPSG
ncbi:hypothetical protein LINPERPRIM_LOCUS18806 [Linum perenne]